MFQDCAFSHSQTFAASKLSHSPENGLSGSAVGAGVVAGAGVLVTGTPANPIVGTNYSILTSSPGPTDGIDGQVFFVVDP